jgi:hypothetical protein
MAEELPSHDEILKAASARREAAVEMSAARARGAELARQDRAKREASKNATAALAREFLRKAKGVLPRTWRGYLIQESYGDCLYLKPGIFGPRWVYVTTGQSTSWGLKDLGNTVSWAGMENTEAWKQCFTNLLLSRMP